MRIEQKFQRLREKERAALVTYITAGDPSLEVTPDIVFQLERSGADIVELGVPFSDPMADGPTIQLASERALKSGTTLRGVLNAVRTIRKRSEIPIILFGYYNPFFAYGLEKLATDAGEAGVDGILSVDLPPDEAGEFKVHTDSKGLNLVFLLAPNSTAERIGLVAEHASGFVYLVSVTGVTGERPNLDYSLEPVIEEIRRHIRLPVGVGFGVSAPSQASKIAKLADAVIVGSALVRIIEKGGGDTASLLSRIGEFVSGLSRACDKKGIINRNRKVN